MWWHRFRVSGESAVSRLIVATEGLLPADSRHRLAWDGSRINP